MKNTLAAELLAENESSGGRFYRITRWGADTEELLTGFLALAVKKGAFLEKGMANPSAGDIAYFENGYTQDFRMEKGYIRNAVSRCANISVNTAELLGDSLLESLEALRSEGKNDSILKSTFIKFLCWLRRDIARALAPSQEKYPPKILCRGGLSRHEMMMLTAAAKAGCDICIAEYAGDGYYNKLPEKEKTALLLDMGTEAFPKDFSLADIRKGLDKYRKKAASQSADFCVNAWLSGNIYDDILTPHEKRGDKSGVYYTCYTRINGAENKMTYLNELYSFYLKLKSTRDPLVIDKPLELPSNAEISVVSRGNYRTPEEMISALSKNIVHSDPKLQQIMRQAFGEIMEMYFADGNELRKGISKAVFLLCWLKRYQRELFGGDRKFPCLIIFGGCHTAAEAMFVKMIARCPADVLILHPDLSRVCELNDSLIYERNFTDSLPADKFPREDGDVSIGTVAYYAERELDSVMYNDTGLFRSHQYSKANSVSLKTMYEEIPELWKSELKYRPSFSVSGDTVNIPVIAAKISGVKNKDITAYWSTLHEMYTAFPDMTLIYKGEPIVTDESSCDYAVGLMKNGRLSKTLVKAHKNYKYGFLKENIQDYILDRLKAFLEMNAVRDLKSGGFEYRVIHICLNMSSEILRLLQKFDFTAVNPKIIYISTGESVISREDAVLLAFLSKLGFDVLFCIPTGYRSAETYLADNVICCIESGEYMFDMQIPDLSKKISQPKGIFKKLFGKKK